MSTIPTSTEFQWIKRKYRDDVAKDLMIEFAKLHVEAALKAASENAETRYIPYTDDEYEIDKNSILNSYPLDNIK